MKILLEHLETKFTPTNLKNGLSYWKKDLFEIQEDTANTIKASVYGTDEYTTFLNFSGEIVTDVNCNCPNNRTLFCKHTAILYYEKFKDLLQLKKSKPRKTATTKKTIKTTENGFESALNNLTIAELKRVLLSIAESDSAIKNRIKTLIYKDHSNAIDVYKIYKNKIQELIRKNKSRGYIDYSQSNRIGNEVVLYAKKAKDALEHNDYNTAISICMAIIETMIKPLMYTDSSSGIFYMGTGIALDVLHSISKDQSLQPQPKKELFAFLLKQLKNKNNKGWGYETDFCKQLINLAESTSDKTKIETAIQHNIKLGCSENSYALSLYLLVEKFDSKIAAKDYLIARRILPEFRSLLYQDAISQKDFKTAKQLMLEGIKDNSAYHGVVINWQNNLLEIALLTHDKEEAKHYAHKLFITHGFFRSKKDYYSLLKAQYSKSDWLLKRNEIRNQLNNQTDVNELLYKEKQYDLLVKNLSKPEGYYGGSIFITEKYLEALLPNFTPALEALMTHKTDAYLKHNQGSKNYKYLCMELIGLKKKGIAIDAIITMMKINYSNRPALLVQLSVFFGE